SETLARRVDTGGNGRRALGGPRRELDRPGPRHRDDEVETVEQRTRELVAVRRKPLRRAGALDGRVAARAARTQIHRRDELEPGREDRASGDPRDRDDAVLERLAEGFQRRPRELGKLVEQENAPVREARFAGPDGCAAPDDRRR